jgi:RNA polymerase sigma-70 factor (ECF subfamily)
MLRCRTARPHGWLRGLALDPSKTPSSDGSDAHLLVASSRGDVSALGRLYDRHAPAMLGVASRILRGRQDAEDLVHDVFVEAWQKAGDYDARRGSVRSWLLVRVRSRGIDRLRSLEAARRAAMIPSGAEGDRSEPRWDGPDRERARAALAALPEEQRRLVELGYYEGLSCAEMAQRVGIPVGTVKSRLAAAVAKLRQTLAAPARAAP